MDCSRYSSGEKVLAQEIIRDFNDEDNPKVYLHYCLRSYPFPVIYKELRMFSP